MSKYLAVAATNKKVLENYGTSEFTNGALDLLAASACGKPVYSAGIVTYSIGTVISAKNDHGKLCVVIDIKDECSYSIRKGEGLALDFRVSQDEWIDIDNKERRPHRTIIKAETFGFNLTLHLAEKLPEIKKLS